GERRNGVCNVVNERRWRVPRVHAPVAPAVTWQIERNRILPKGENGRIECVRVETCSMKKYNGGVESCEKIISDESAHGLTACRSSCDPPHFGEGSEALHSLGITR